MLKTPRLPRIQAEYGKKVMSRFVSETRRYEFPLASFSPRSFCLSIINVFEIQRGLSDNCVRRYSRKTARRNRYVREYACNHTIYVNNTTMHIQCSNVTMRTNKVPRTCNSYRNGVGNASHNYERYFRARRNFQQLH